MTDKNGFEQLRAKYRDVLTKAFNNNNVDLLASFSLSSTGPAEAERRAAMDQAFRDNLLQMLPEAPASIESFVTFCVEACRKQVVTPTMPVVLLGDVFDTLTLNKCEEMFTYVENGVHIWKEELFFSSCKNNLLRMCNDLLRRLSRSQNTVFCGRILLFLAKFFPFSERSGLNIVSEFNLDNVTEFSKDSSSNLKDSLEDEIVAENTKSKLNIDYNLYCKFWGLQDFFRNPNTCYNKLQWKTFVAHSSSVLSAFGSYKLEVVELHKSKMNRVKPVSTDVEMQESREQHYFAKFLTNQKLLELQLSDSNFRRCVLIQFLILFQYLTSSVKFKMDTQELKVDQTEWVKETTALVYRLLGETPHDGKKFSECVKHILRREEHWNTWKNDGCPEFQKPKPSVHEAQDEVKKSRKRKKPLGDIIKDYESQGKYYMGNPYMTKLWNLCPDNLTACRTTERDFMPSLESYMCLAATDSSRQRTSEGAWGWRALRLLARRSPHFFTHTNNPIRKLTDYLDGMVKRVTQEVAMNAAASETNGDTSTDKTIKQEEDITEEQLEADLMKSSDNYLEQVPDSTHGVDEEYEKPSRSRVTMITPAQLDLVSAKLTNWKKLAAKLGYKQDEIEYFETENPTDAARARYMLQLWFDDDEDASVENLLYIMEGLELIPACEALKDSEK